MKEQGFPEPPFMPDLRAVAEYNNDALKRVFKGKIKGCFLERNFCIIHCHMNFLLYHLK